MLVKPLCHPEEVVGRLIQMRQDERSRAAALRDTMKRV
jgi:hypothetical protein